MVTESSVLGALTAVKDPDLQRDIVTLGFVKNLRIDGGRVAFTIELTTPACPVKDQMRDQARAVVLQVPGVTGVDIDMTAQVRSTISADLGKAPVEGVKNIIAVGAGKGGVGKTTVAVNLAIALSQCGGRVAMIDGDIYGPNVPIMLGIQTQLTTDGKKIIPAEQYGIQLVSMAFLTGDDSPVIWRGPMLHGIIQQFFREVRWDNIDYLIVAALGLIENMSHFVCPECRHESDIFGKGGGEALASELAIPFLGRVPIYEPIRIGGDTGVPLPIGERD